MRRALNLRIRASDLIGIHPGLSLGNPNITLLAMSRTKRRCGKNISTKVEQGSSANYRDDLVLLRKSNDQTRHIPNNGPKSQKATTSPLSSGSRQPSLDGRPLSATTNGAQQQQQRRRGDSDPAFALNRSNQRQNASKLATVTTQSRTGMKRKAAEVANSTPSAQRFKTRGDNTLMDIKYMKENYEIPSASQYPAGAGKLFKIDTIWEGFNNSPLNVRVVWDMVPSSQRQRHQIHRCTLVGTLSDRRSWTAKGEGRDKRSAVQAACLRLLADLHSDKVLSQMYPPLDKIDEEKRRMEKDAKLDVYNYAARFAFVPQFHVRNAQRSHGRIRAVVEVTIELEEQGLKVSGWATNLADAELAASLKFKEAAERYHAQHGDESIVIKDSGALTTGNIRSFFDYYKLRNREHEVTVSNEDAKLGVNTGGSCYKSQVFINKKTLAEPVHARSRQQAEELAQLTTAIALIREEPQLLDAFQHALSAGGGNAILMPVRPVNLILRQDAVEIMQDTLKKVRKLGLPQFDKIDISRDARNHEPTITARVRQRLAPSEKAERNKVLRQKQDAARNNPAMTQILNIKDSLPMSKFRDQVLELVNSNDYCIIMGATGSGKTTQVPQILFEDAIARNAGADCDIICTQPRRIAATSVAKRVADERGENLQETVGYHVRFDAKVARSGGSINFCTTGILLQQLQHMPDEMLDTVSHIVIDEVHERDILIDFLMILIKRTIRARRLSGKSVPKIVLMSATIDEKMFAKYFEEKLPNGKIMPCPSISVPGRTYPVKEKYFDTIITELQSNYNFSGRSSHPMDQDTLDYIQSEKSFKTFATSTAASEDDEAEALIDWKREKVVGADGQVTDEKADALVPISLIGTTVAHIAKTTIDGALLVFLPGYEEIKDVEKYLCFENPLGVDFNDQSRFKLFTLHSSVPAAEQSTVFDPVPNGCRKVILSTNIAETSVTIPDIQYVIDTGKIREKRYDQIRRITKLQCTWVSKSNAKQRAGRAGRVQNGNYYALFSRARFESLRNVGLPEMLRSDLQEICLGIKAQAFKTPIRDFLAQAIEPPAPAAIDVSVKNLIALQALDEREELKPLGRLLADLPIHPSLGKMILLGVIFRCLDPMIILGATINERSPLLRPPERRREAMEKQKRFLEGTCSDHLCLINAIRETRTIGHTKGTFAARQFADEHFIHMGAFKTIASTAEQIEELLVESGIIPYTPLRDKFEGELGHPTLNKNANNINMLKALILAGVHPNIAICKGTTFRSPSEQNALMQSSSFNAVRRDRGDSMTAPQRDSLWSYSTLQKSNDGNTMTIRDSTPITPLMAALFGGRLTSHNNLITMDDWLPFFVKSEFFGNRDRLTADVVQFRDALDRVLAAAYNSLKPRNRSGYDLATGHTFLADDAVRETFASGVLNILDNDAGFVPAVDSYRPPRR